jgi:hypothetical protein
MTMFRIMSKDSEEQAREPRDRFDSRLEALAGSLESPITRRQSPFERVKRQPRPLEA